MQVTTVSEALEMEVGTPIPAIKGKVVSVYNRATGENKYGEWSFQTFILGDGTNTIRVKLKNLPTFKFAKGDSVYLTGERGSKGWVGLKRETEDFKGEPQDIVMVTKGATITKTQGGSAPAAGGSAAPSPTVSPEKFLAGLVAQYHRCYQGASYLVGVTAETEIPLRPEDAREVATTLFIEMNKQGYHGGFKLPEKEEPAPPAEEEPTPAEEEPAPTEEEDDNAAY